ncbi:MAG: two-component regulator propeller domain-containing protein [Bacteroidales bacterium]
MIVEHYTTENGLLNEYVYCTLKGSDGFVWFGTWYGLCRFDGAQFKYYNSREEFSPTMPPRKIQRMLEEKNGNIWIKTVDRKLYLFCRNKELFIPIADEMKEFAGNTQIFKFEKTEDGEILVLTKNMTLVRLESEADGKIQITPLHKPTQEDLSKVDQNLLIESKSYVNWIGTDNQIYSFPKGIHLSNKPSDFITRQIFSDSKSKLTCIFRSNSFIWIGDQQSNIFRVDLETGNVAEYQLPINSRDAINSIVTGDERTLFITTASGGVYEYSYYNNQYRVIPLTVSGRGIYQGFADSYNKIWWVEEDISITYFDPVSRISKRFFFPEGAKMEKFQFQDANENGMIFLMPAGKTAIFNRDDLTLNYLDELLPNTRHKSDRAFLHNLFDKDGILWLSSKHDGVYRINFPSNRFYQVHPEKFIGKAIDPAHLKGVRTISQTSNGEIWISSRDQEVMQLNSHFQLIYCYNARTYNLGSVYHIMEDSKRNLWFSTKGEGLIKGIPDSSQPNGYRFVRYNGDNSSKNGLNSNDVYATFEDRKGNIWVAVFGGGLNLIAENDGKESIYNKNNCFLHYPGYGLYTNIRAIEEDETGRIWVGTMDGLMSFKNDFDNPAEIEFELYPDKKYGDGIVDNDIYCMYKDASSRIWMSAFGEGLYLLKGYDKENRTPLFDRFDMSSGLKSNVIMSITGDAAGHLWLATEKGISRFTIKDRSFRNFDRYDGFPNVKMEENCTLFHPSGQLYFGTKSGILVFSPDNIGISGIQYPTYIVDFRISNKSVRLLENNPFEGDPINRRKQITLKSSQSMFSIEYASLNYHNINQVRYRYKLEGYEKDWHLSGSNRLASYSNIPHGNYRFIVEAIDETNPDLDSAAMLEIKILPPWYKTTWAFILYFLLGAGLMLGGCKLILFLLRVKNDLYIDQKLAELKIKFFTNISHELRTPLTLIKGPLQELKEKEQLSSKGHQYLDLMERNTNNMLLLVNQILDFRKIQNGKMRLRVSHFNLVVVLDQIIEEFKVLAEERDISYLSHSEEDEILIWADREKIESVIRNLLSNAFKFTKDGGSILVCAGYLKNSDKCFIQIEDTGIGIAQNKLAEIFERFGQSDNGLAFNKQGSGIGLALTQEIVHMHGGEVRVESKVDKGSVFTVELKPGKAHYKRDEVDFYLDDPVNKQTPGVDMSETHEKIHEPEDSNRPTLLLVEDNKDLCEMMKLQLESQFNMVFAHDGMDGLKKVRLHHPDIVVTDYMMPEMDGLVMLENIRKDFQISHIPVIMLTAKGSEEAKTEAISKGANAYITKPFSKEYLQARIDNLLKVRSIFREKLRTQEKLEELNEEYDQCLVKKDVELLKKIYQVLEENIDDSEYTIDTIAATIGLSRSAFFKKLKSLTGLAPVDFVKEFRLNKSVELIRTSDLTISEIAFAVGFKDPGYFSKTFKKKYNQTPREYQNEIRNAGS